MIICAIEEATAEAVVLTAAELAPALGARVLLLHVERDPALFNSLSDRDHERRRAARRGDEFLRTIGALLPYGTRVEARVALGAPAGEILAVAEDVGASLIIVGSRQRGAALRALTGSVSENVVRRASCPVVIAPVAIRCRGESGSGNDRSILVGVCSAEHTMTAWCSSMPMAIPVRTGLHTTWETPRRSFRALCAKRTKAQVLTPPSSSPADRPGMCSTARPIARTLA